MQGLHDFQVDPEATQVDVRQESAAATRDDIPKWYAGTLISIVDSGQVRCGEGLISITSNMKVLQESIQ